MIIIVMWQFSAAFFDWVAYRCLRQEIASSVQAEPRTLFYMITISSLAMKPHTFGMKSA